MTTHKVNSDASFGVAMAALTDMYRAHGYVEVEFKRKGGKRTLSQNNALHLWCRMLADALNEAGLDQRKVLKPGVEIPWTEPAVKNQLWRPIQEALTGHKSTTDISTVDPTQIHETLCRHFADKFGVACPAWPTREP